MGDAMFDMFSVPPGDHVYVLAPVALSVTEPDWQMVDADADAVTVGSGKTVTDTVATAEHAPAVPVTV